ncbi:3'-phosphoadenosine 5'-phosphosulfate sulfotransferase [Diplogelasinospora grovesii]|uniref:FAD synthase n=1 Tax=Diplogelasinospora grovesii TaxID=303347 RepID=A0AAN6MWK4_9PEZI|nr:3'-phosphoadenosine 5'-phosphosulfate sulfotransferase [Diplogelasinospora grovesii]
MTQDSPSQHDSPHPNGVAKTAASASDWPHAPRRLPQICHTMRRKVMAFLDEDLPEDNGVLRSTQRQARVSVGVIEEALRRYGTEGLSLSYNGGKDCLVLLVLILACLPGPPISTASPSSPEAAVADATAAADPSKESPAPRYPPVDPRSLPSWKNPQKCLQAIYIAPPDPFPEVEDFVKSTTRQYNLDLARYPVPMRPALEAYLGDRPGVKAIFMGTRRTDPHSEFLEHFTPTDADWPQFMRVNPIIDWHYAEIWAFIRKLGIPYCSLYSRGFTSLGGMNNTRPNPALALGGETDKFRPAHELVRDDEERLGRDR